MRARSFPAFLLGVFALLAAAFVGPAAAQPYGPPPPQPYGPPPGQAYGPPPPGQPYYGPSDPRDGVQPLDRLLPGIRRAHPGDFYDAEGPTYGPRGDPHYHLKWLTPDGRVIWYDTDARNGRVLRASPGRDSFDGNPFVGPPNYGRPFGPPAAPAYRYGQRFAPQYARPYGNWSAKGGGRRRH
jgi:hypothetical protein